MKNLLLIFLCVIRNSKKFVLQFFFTTVLTSTIGFIHAQAPNWKWAGAVGGQDEDASRSMAIDAAGNLYVTGGFSSIADFDPGPANFNLNASGNGSLYISKYDDIGNFIWAKGIAGSFGSFIMLDDSANIYVTGWFEGSPDFDPGAGIFNLTSGGSADPFIAKYDSAGSFIWARSFPGTYDAFGHSIVVDDDGNVYTSGMFFTPTDFDPGIGTFILPGTGYDLYISKLDANGNFIWAKNFDGSSYYFPSQLYLDNSQHIYFSGYFKDTADFDPGSGITNLIASGYSDVFVCKLDTAGNFIWAKQIGGAGADRCNAMQLDAAGNIYLAGGFDATADFDPGAGVFNLSPATNQMIDIFVSKLDSEGNFLWAKAMGGPVDDIAYSIALDGSGNVYTSGSFELTADFDPDSAGVFLIGWSTFSTTDIFVSKLDSSGNFVWAAGAGCSAGNDRGYCCRLNPNHGLYVTGDFECQPLSFGPYTVTNSDTFGLTNDIFITELDHVTGIGKDFQPQFFALYPNPAQSYFNIQIDSQIQYATLDIYNLTGNKIYSADAVNPQLTTVFINVDCSLFPPGIYLARLHTKVMTATEKILIQN